MSKGSIKPQPLLSIIIPVYNEAENLTQIYKKIGEVLSNPEMDREIIFADDGSTDNSWQLIEALHEKNSNVRGVRLSRNFGHQYALMAGLANACGDAVITMDGDLQHPVKMIPELIYEWQKGYQVVHTVRVDPPSTSFLKKISAKIYYKLFSYLSGVKIEYGMADFRLLDRQVVDEILQFQEQGLFFRGIVQWVGFRSTTLSYMSEKRLHGTSKYTPVKMLKLAWNGITSFSIVPLRLGIFIGILTSFIAFMEIIYAVLIRLFTDSAVPGWASAISILSFLFGILFILLGIVGEYIGRILIEVRQRPRFLVAEKVGIDDTPVEK